MCVCIYIYMRVFCFCIGSGSYVILFKFTLCDCVFQVIIFTFLPVLIFESAFTAEFHVFRHQLFHTLLLAILGVMLASFLTGLFVKYVFPYGWNWNTSLMTGQSVSQ